MKRARVTLKGVSPLLMDRMTEEVMDGLQTGVRPPGYPPDATHEQIAEPKIYRDADGKPGIPIQNMFSCLRHAGRYVKNGRAAISTAKSTTVPALVILRGIFLPLNNGATWTPDRKRAVLRLQGKEVPVPAIRPLFNDWGLDVEFDFDETRVNEGILKKLFETAGSVVGLCAYRPQCGGPYGRFEVTKFEVEDEASAPRKGGKKN